MKKIVRSEYFDFIHHKTIQVHMDLYSFFAKGKTEVALKVECYERMTQAVNNKCPYPKAITTLPDDYRENFALAHVHGKAIYITGGRGKTIACQGGNTPSLEAKISQYLHATEKHAAPATKTALAFNLYSQELIQIADMNVDRYGHSCTTIGEDVYVVGGWNDGEGDLTCE